MERLRNLNAGLGQYCFQLGRALAVQPAAGEAHFECYLPGHLAGIFGPNFGYRATRKWHKLTGVATEAALWHSMHQDTEYLPADAGTAMVMTIHDLNFLEREDYPGWRKKLKVKRLQQKIQRCQGLVFISEFVKNTVHANLIVPPGMQEKVIYNGVQAGVAGPATKGMSKKPFLFSIGMHPKKNYAVALPILKANPAYQWVIAGADDKGYQSELEKAAAAGGVGQQLTFTGPVTEAEKWRLYQDCAALIFPSVSEGFGLPVLEAMAFGKPVFLSDKTSLPEIGGAEAYYFKNFDPEHVQQVFETGIQDFNQDLEKPNRLKKHAAAFTWENAAKDYLKFYHSIAQ